MPNGMSEGMSDNMSQEKVCQIIWCQKVCHDKGCFLEENHSESHGPIPPISPKLLLGLLQQLTLPMQHTLHVVLHEAGCCLGIYDPTAHGPHKLLDASWMKVRKAWGTNRISIPLICHWSQLQHGVQLARTFLMSSNHFTTYTYIYIIIYIYICVCNSPLTWFGGTTYETSICGLWSSCCEISSQCTVDLRWAPPQKVDLVTKDKPFSMGI